MAWSRALALLAAPLIGLIGACASAPPPLPRTYEDIVNLRLEAARQSQTFVLRYNPADCGCSPFEILLGENAPPGTADDSVPADPSRSPAGAPHRVAGRSSIWQRVEIAGVDESDPVVLALQDHIARRTLASTRDRTLFRVEGRLESRLGSCGRGSLFVSLVPSGLVGFEGDEATPRATGEVNE